MRLRRIGRSWVALAALTLGLLPQGAMAKPVAEAAGAAAVSRPAPDAGDRYEAMRAYHDRLQEAITREAEQKLSAFVRAAWRKVEPRPLVWNWHLDAICDHLQAVTDGHIRQLVMNVPPRHTKSLTTSVFWPAWEWGPRKLPQVQGLFTSYGQKLAVRDAVKSRRLMTSNWYQDRWGHVYEFTTDQNVKSYYVNDKGGYRISGSFESGVTGEGGDRIVVDDPTQVDDADNLEILDHVIDLWDGTLSTRGNDARTVAFVVIMQRLHERDLTGHILQEQGWTHLCLPAEYEPKRKCVVYLHERLFFADPRTRAGQLLNPERFPGNELAVLKRKLGTYRASGQLQQAPAPPEGGIFKRAWMGKFWVVLPQFHEIAQTWDMAVEGKETSKTGDTSYVVGQVWGRRGAEKYLLDEVRGQWDFVTTCEQLELLSLKWPQASLKLIEKKGNGPAVINALRKRVGGMVPSEPVGDKLTRAIAVSPEFEAGNVFLPHPSKAPWVHDWIDELSKHPKGETDRGDAMAQLLTRWMLRDETGHDSGPGEIVGVIRK